MQGFVQGCLLPSLVQVAPWSFRYLRTEAGGGVAGGVALLLVLLGRSLGPVLCFDAGGWSRCVLRDLVVEG